MYSLQPIQYYSVNDFAPLEEWQIQNGVAAVIHFMLVKTDSLGTRRFVTPPGTTVQLAFMKSRPATLGGTSQSVTKNATQSVPADDKSIYQVALTAEETQNVLSGSIQLIITSGGAASKYKIPYAVKKMHGEPGY
jgi:hypothetical protein